MAVTHHLTMPSSDPIDAESSQNQGTGRNTPSDAAFSPVKAVESEQPIERTQPPEQLSLNIQWALQVVHSKQRKQVEKNRQQYQKEKQQRARTEHIAQLNQWMDSGDPILVAEAGRQINRIEAGLLGLDRKHLKRSRDCQTPSLKGFLSGV